jgi:hypothetical protein
LTHGQPVLEQIHQGSAERKAEGAGVDHGDAVGCWL